jgi:predicted phosphoribosyltransferase
MRYGAGGSGPRFADRVEAGRILAERLAAYRGGNALVLGLPRGGVVVAAEVARRLGLELDVVVARKLGAPGMQELAIGAVTADGERYLNRPLIESLGVSEVYLRAATAAQLEEARAREAYLRAVRPEAPAKERTVILVDDGLATGATMRAAIQSVRRREAQTLVVAVPVAASATCAELRPLVDEVVCPNQLEDLGAIGYYYDRFGAVEDAEVRALLEASRVHPVAA